MTKCGPMGKCPKKTPSPGECCSLSAEVKAKAFSWSPPADPVPAPKCDAGSELKGTVLIGQTASASADPGMTAAKCCALAGDAGIGYTFFSGDMPVLPGGFSKCPSKCCLIWATIETTIAPNATTAGAISGKNKPKTPGKCELFSAVDGHSAAPGTTSGGSMYEKVPGLYNSWPSNSPWVTAVGATRFVGQVAGNEEMATDQFGSGGGFSTTAFSPRDPLAKYQDSAVTTYLSTCSKAPPFPPPAAFDPAGRATPDMSALGEGYQVVLGGHVAGIGGTSASTPAFAGLVSLLNEARLAKGGKSMGFLNPFIYQNVDAWTDVTKGTNAVGRGSGPIPYGYNASKGWDPATGMGTPLFDKLLAAAMKAQK